MNAPKRIKLDPSPSPSEHDQNPQDADADADDQEQEHCPVCLQSFLDRTIVPVCAHEFCFDCILLWSEQSRKCPLCARSFDDSYLIHRIRSQYDYQKHYLPPSRSSPPPPLTGASRANALRNTRRERQWGRRQRQQREEADQLERAVARRRWIYQHHLYAKHVASNPYTRYRPFPTPAQFAASPDRISRMTIFLRRELRVWPNLDVEFLTTYTISLMKSIDIRSESAVKLLSEFLDLDTPYTAGARHVNAEHFAHEIYSYLRSPYRDLNMYDQSAQYDTPPEIPPPRETERRSRWSVEPSPSRSRSHSRNQSPVPRRENSAMHSHAPRHGRDSSAEARREDKPNHRHGSNRSRRRIPHRQEDHAPRNHPSGTRHSPLDGVQGILRNGHSGGTSYPKASSFAVLAENQDSNFPVEPHLRDDKGRGQATNNMVDIVPARDFKKMSAPQGDDLMTACEADVTHLINGPLEGTGDGVASYVDNMDGSSSANLNQPPRKRSAGSSVRVHPRDRTLSESVQAYLSRPAAPRWLPSVPGDEQPTTTDRSTTDARPSLVLRLTGKAPSPRKTTVDGDPSTLDDDSASEQPHHGRRSRVPSSDRVSFTAPEHANAAEPGGTPSTNNATAAAALEGACVDVLGRWPSTSSGGADHTRGRTGADASTSPSPTPGSKRAAREADLEAGRDDASPPTSGSRSGGTAKWTDVDASAALETRLRARARVRVRLAAIKGAGGGAVGSGSGGGMRTGDEE